MVETTEDTQPEGVRNKCKERELSIVSSYKDRYILCWGGFQEMGPIATVKTGTRFLKDSLVTSCVIWGKGVNLCGPQGDCMKNEDNNRIYLIDLIKGLNEIVSKMCS